jgi:hypothetical protein
MNKFQNRFFQHIMEQDNERAAMEASLDTDTNPADFDVNAVPDGSELADLSRQVSQAKSDKAKQMEQQLNNWIAKCTEFREFLNEPTNPGSMGTILSKAEPETIFDTMNSALAGKIPDMAGELSSLIEKLNGYANKSQSSSFKYK